MKTSKRNPTKYPGVFFREAERIGASGVERVYYIVFKKDGKVYEEKVGRQYADDMTEAKASRIRGERIEGKRASRKEVREAKEAKRRENENRPTIARLWYLYGESLIRGKPSAQDQSRYTLYLEPSFGTMVPDEILTPEVDRLRVRLVKQGKSPQTVKHVLALLRRLIKFGVKKGLCEAPVPSKLHFEIPHVDNEKTETLTPEQVIALKKALDEEPDQNAAALMRLALVTGMRRGALLALRWDDLDFSRGFITLRGEVAKKGKTESIPMSAVARQILEAIESVDSPYVFPGKNGEQRKEFRRLPERVKRKAGLPDDFRPLHGLRHVYASLLASSGKVDLYTLQKLLTHSSPQMTQRYAHLADEAMQRAASVADEIFSLDMEKK